MKPDCASPPPLTAEAYTYLRNLSPKEWVDAFFRVPRYNYITSAPAESAHQMFVDCRNKDPVTALQVMLAKCRKITADRQKEHTALLAKQVRGIRRPTLRA